MYKTQAWQQNKGQRRAQRRNTQKQNQFPSHEKKQRVFNKNSIYKLLIKGNNFFVLPKTTSARRKMEIVLFRKSRNLLTLKQLKYAPTEVNSIISFFYKTISLHLPSSLSFYLCEREKLTSSVCLFFFFVFFCPSVSRGVQRKLSQFPESAKTLCKHIWIFFFSLTFQSFEGDLV